MKETDHLNFENRINYGVFYTPEMYISIAISMIAPFIDENTIIIDSSCGSGLFFSKIDTEKTKCIGYDIDSKAIEYAKEKYPSVTFYNTNTLLNVSRETYNIPEDKKLIVVGNPPYNDTTSQIRNDIKKNELYIDDDIKKRDLGISFLLSYNKLKADYICVLHPLSYLVKETNFKSLNSFADNYKLVDSLIVSSVVFNHKKSTQPFPIIIALYKRSKTGMKFNYIKEYPFKVSIPNMIGTFYFSLHDFDYVTDYIRKYPQKNAQPKEDDIFFYTLRDINALRRNKTFLDKYTPNAIIINKFDLEYYIYIDIFKDFINHVPYYFNNLNIMIDLRIYKKYKQYFVRYALKKYDWLSEYYNKVNGTSIETLQTNIKEYFKQLLGNHYVE